MPWILGRVESRNALQRGIVASLPARIIVPTPGSDAHDDNAHAILLQRVQIVNGLAESQHWHTASSECPIPSIDAIMQCLHQFAAVDFLPRHDGAHYDGRDNPSNGNPTGGTRWIAFVFGRVLASQPPCGRCCDGQQRGSQQDNPTESCWLNLFA